MSRCFPFPPPGYEKRLRNSEQESLLSKEKHKGKKRKKERKDKERKENKERNGNDGNRDKHNDGSRDKHKEKKDKKEKHKDKKREREKDKIGSSSDTHNETHAANEIKDSKITKDLGRRIRDEEQGATNCLAKNVSSTTNRRIENNATGTSTTVGKESFTTNKTVANGSVFMHRKIDKSIPPFHQSRTDGSEIPSTINEKQKTASRYNVQEFTSLEKRNGKHAPPFLYKRTEGVETPASIEKQLIGGSEKRLTPTNDKHTPLFHNRRTEGIETLTGIQKQKIGGSEKKLTPPPMLKKFEEINKRKVQINQKAGKFATEDRRNHAIIRPSDESPSQKIENVHAIDSNQKIRNNNMASNVNGLSKKSSSELDWLVENITSIPEKTGGAEATEKERFLYPNIKCTEAENKNTKDKLVDAKMEGRHKDRDGNERNKKEKDSDRQKKKEERKRMKTEQQHTNHDKLRDITKKDQINNLNSKSLVAPHLVNLNASSADGHNKRKEFETNGLLLEPQFDERPNKLPRTDASSSYQSMKNGKTLEFNHGALNLGTTNSTIIKRGVENNGNVINGEAKIELQPSHIPKHPITHSALKLGTTNSTIIKRGMENNGNVINGEAKIELQPSHIPKHPITDSALKLGTTNSTIIKRGMETNGNVINGEAKIELQPSHIPKHPITPVTHDPKKTSAVNESSKKEKIRTRPPHRDTKYLDMIYSIPKMEEIPESKEEDWLFKESNVKHAAKAKIEANESPPKVWAQGLRIDEADIFALPYVVPF